LSCQIPGDPRLGTDLLVDKVDQEGTRSILAAAPKEQRLERFGMRFLQVRACLAVNGTVEPGFHERTAGRRNDVKMLRDERGQATILMALFMGIVMLGFIAFALDVGYLFQKKRLAQAAADAAVLAAAEEGANTANGQNAANIAATLNGFNTSLATNPATVTLITQSTGNYPSTAPVIPSNWVTATVSQPIHTFFLGAFNRTMSTVTVSATSVAAGGLNISDCLCLEGTTGTDLNMSNNAKFTGG
jgi:Flp pilus assembly protein TadG